MIVHNVAQNSPQWLSLRAGIPTASVFDRIITPKTMKPSGQSENLLNWLLAEWVLGHPLDSAETEWMTRGHELEPFAAKAYEFETASETELVGFITTDGGMVGASPDRLVGADGMLEIKCPSPSVHVGYLRRGGVERDHWVQLQGQLYVADDRQWVDVFSYCPPFPNVRIRIERDPEFQAALDVALQQFVAQLLKSREEFEAKYGPIVRPVPEPQGDFDLDADDVAAIYAASQARQ